MVNETLKRRYFILDFNNTVDIDGNESCKEAYELHPLSFLTLISEICSFKQAIEDDFRVDPSGPLGRRAAWVGFVWLGTSVPWEAQMGLQMRHTPGGVKRVGKQREKERPGKMNQARRKVSRQD